MTTAIRSTKLTWENAGNGLVRCYVPMVGTLTLTVEDATDVLDFLEGRPNRNGYVLPSVHVANRDRTVGGIDYMFIGWQGPRLTGQATRHMPDVNWADRPDDYYQPIPLVYSGGLDLMLLLAALE